MNKFNKVNLMVMVMTFYTTVSMAGVPTVEVPVLYADFNDKVPGSLLGEGGAAQGEPVDLSALTGTITEDTPGENFLLVENNSGSSSGSNLRWDFLNNAEITEGVVTFSFQFTPSALERYNIGMRESGGSSRTFLTLVYGTGGTISGSDAAGVITLANNTYTVGVTQNYLITFDMDDGTSEVIINGNTVLTGREHGITDRGVGRLLTGYSNGNTASSFTLDNILVLAPSPLPLVLDADFENKVLGQLIGTGGAEVGEPVDITSGLLTEIVEFGETNQALLLENPIGGMARGMSWQFLNNAEAREGIVAIETDVFFDQLDRYQFLVREAMTNASTFTNVIFYNTGNIIISDSSGSVANGGTYQAGQLYRLRLTFDLDNGIYSIWLNGDKLVEDKPHGVTTGRGIGSFLMTFHSNSSVDASFVVDDLQVGVSEPTFDLIFLDDFE